MQRQRCIRLLAPVVAPATLSLFLVACDKVPQPGTNIATTTQGAQADVQASTSAQPKAEQAVNAKAPPSGVTLRHLPAACSNLKLYVDLERFGQYEKTGARIADVASKGLARTSADEKFILPVVISLQQRGVRLDRDLKEVAACADSPQDWVALLAIDLSKVETNPNALLVAAATAAGQKEVAIRHSAGVDYVVPAATGGALGFVAPGVLGYASSPQLLAKATQRNTAGMPVSDSQNHLATIRFPAGDKTGAFELTGQKKELTATLHLPLDTEQQAELRKDATRYLAMLHDRAKQKLGGAVAKHLELSEVKQFLQDFDRLDLSVTKEELNATLTVSTAQIRDAVAAAAAIKPAQIEQMVHAMEG